MNSLFESEHVSGDLEAAIEAVAARIPTDVYERLGAHYYPAMRRPLRRAALVGAPIAAASAVVAVLVTGFGPTTQIAFAGWTATPTTPAAGQVTAAEKLCLATANAGLQSARSTRMQESLLGTPEGSFEPVVVDTRGPYTLVVMSVTGTVGREEAACLTGPGTLATHPQIQTSTSMATPPPEPDTVGTTGWGKGGTSSTGSAEDTVLLGTVGATVSTVTLTLTNRSSVTASVANGTYAAWWPGAASPASAIARTGTGRTVERSFGSTAAGQKLKITTVHVTVTGQS
jgi:hypothetical protein